MLLLRLKSEFIIRVIAVLMAAALIITGIVPCGVYAAADDPAAENTSAGGEQEQNQEQDKETSDTGTGSDADAADTDAVSVKADILQKSIRLAWKSSKALTLTEDSTEELVWTSSKPSVARVSQDGTVTGVRPGKAVIRCSCLSDSTVCDSCKVRVKVKPVYLAHKGYSAKAPENTIPAIKKAVKAGFTGVEIDMFESKKEKSKKYKPFILVCHDSNLKRLTGKKKKITKLTHRSYKKYRIKKHVHGRKRYGAQRIPTLEQAMRAVWKTAAKKGKKDYILELDIKQKNISKRAVKKIIRLAGEHKVRINSPHIKAIKRFKRYRKSGNTELWVYKNSRSKKKTRRFVKRAVRLGVDGISMPPNRWSRGLIRYCKKHNVKMATKTESRKTARRMIKKRL